MIAESENSYPTGMWVIFYRRLDDPDVWKTMRYQRNDGCLLYTSPSPRDRTRSRMPSSA